MLFETNYFESHVGLTHNKLQMSELSPSSSSSSSSISLPSITKANKKTIAKNKKKLKKGVNIKTEALETLDEITSVPRIWLNENLSSSSPASSSNLTNQTESPSFNPSEYELNKTNFANFHTSFTDSGCSLSYYNTSVINNTENYFYTQNNVAENETNECFNQQYLEAPVSSYNNHQITNETSGYYNSYNTQTQYEQYHDYQNQNQVEPQLHNHSYNNQPYYLFQTNNQSINNQTNEATHLYENNEFYYMNNESVPYCSTSTNYNLQHNSYQTSHTYQLASSANNLDNVCYAANVNHLHSNSSMSSDMDNLNSSMSSSNSDDDLDDSSNLIDAKYSKLLKYQSNSECNVDSYREPGNNGNSSGSKRKRKRILNRLQRAEATMREKRRMLKLNKAFEELRKVLPISEFAKNKLSRAETLKSAIEYIERMSQLLSI